MNAEREANNHADSYGDGRGISWRAAANIFESCRIVVDKLTIIDCNATPYFFKINLGRFRLFAI